MNKQIEITQADKLLTEDGNLKQAGYMKRNILDYNREAVPKKLRSRIKEWDFYQVGNDRYSVQLCFFNISIASAASYTVIDLTKGTTVGSAVIRLGTMNRFMMPRNGDVPNKFCYKDKNTELVFDTTTLSRKLTFTHKDVEIELEMDMQPNQESITMATPFSLPHRFFYTQKINCMPTKGFVKKGNETLVTFDKSDSYTVLDWGRGVWPHKNSWYWGNASTRLKDGKLFGFEITWGFGDETKATETALFYDGKCHKIGAVDVKVPPKENGYTKNWEFYSDDNRFNLTLTPVFDHASGVKVLGLLGQVAHQVHGYFDGTVILDDGTELIIERMYGFCEYVENLW